MTQIHPQLIYFSQQFVIPMSLCYKQIYFMFICVRFTYDQNAFWIERDFFFTPIRFVDHDSWKAGIPYLTWWIMRSVNWRFIPLATSDFNFVAIFFYYCNSFSRKDTKARFCLPLKVAPTRQMGFSEIDGLDCTTKTQSRSILSAIFPAPHICE